MSTNLTAIRPDATDIQVQVMRDQSITLSMQLQGRECSRQVTRDVLACLEELLTHQPAIHVRARLYASRAPSAATMAAWIAEYLERNEIWD
jgi:hypothetical protein